MGQSRADKPILIDQNLKFQISHLGRWRLGGSSSPLGRQAPPPLRRSQCQHHSSLGDRPVWTSLHMWLEFIALVWTFVALKTVFIVL